jgi:hypothetical protein
MLRRPQVGRMGFEFSDGGLRIAFQEEVRPLSEVQSFPSSDNIENVSIPGLQPIPQFPLRCLPSVRFPVESEDKKKEGVSQQLCLAGQKGDTPCHLRAAD